MLGLFENYLFEEKKNWEFNYFFEYWKRENFQGKIDSRKISRNFQIYLVITIDQSINQYNEKNDIEKIYQFQGKFPKSKLSFWNNFFCL